MSNQFYQKATTKQEFKDIRKNARHQYRFLQSGLTTKDDPQYPELVAQMTIYAGINKCDKQMFDKGVAKFFKAVAERRISMENQNFDNDISSLAICKNTNYDKTLSKEEQIEAIIIMETTKKEILKQYDEFVLRKLIYYSEQMPIMYEEYWEGMKKIQEEKKK